MNSRAMIKDNEIIQNILFYAFSTFYNKNLYRKQENIIIKILWAITVIPVYSSFFLNLEQLKEGFIFEFQEQLEKFKFSSDVL